MSRGLEIARLVIVASSAAESPEVKGGHGMMEPKAWSIITIAGHAEPSDNTEGDMTEGLA